MAQQGIDQELGAKPRIHRSHIFQKVVLVEKRKPVILEKKIVVEDFPHQGVIGANRGPLRRLHRIQPGVQDSGREVGLRVGVPLSGPVDRTSAVPRIGKKPLLMGRVSAEGAVIDLRVQVGIVCTVKIGGHIREIGELKAEPGLGDQGKLDEDIAIVDMAQYGFRIGAPADAPEHLLGLLAGPGLQHVVDLLEG